MKKHFVLVSVTILFLSMVSGLTFDVNVDALTDSSEYGIEYRNNTTVQQINTTVLNGGSIGCQFRLKGEFRYANETQTRYSSPHALFPGADELIQLYFIPENYTGTVQTTLYSDYCGQEKQLTQFNFTSPESVISNQTVESKVLTLNSSASSVEIDHQNGRLVPKDTPAYWKAGSSDIVNGSTVIEYDAPIFTEGRNLTYTVLNADNELVGETEIYLKSPEPTLLDKVYQNIWKLLLGLSVFLNLGLIAKRVRET